MNGGVVLLLLVVAAWLLWFVRDRHIKGWKRPLFRKTTYNGSATGGRDVAKGHAGYHSHGGGAGSGGSGFGGGGGSY